MYEKLLTGKSLIPDKRSLALLSEKNNNFKACAAVKKMCEISVQRKNSKYIYQLKLSHEMIAFPLGKMQLTQIENQVQIIQSIPQQLHDADLPGKRGRLHLGRIGALSVLQFEHLPKLATVYEMSSHEGAVEAAVGLLAWNPLWHVFVEHSHLSDSLARSRKL